MESFLENLSTANIIALVVSFVALLGLIFSTVITIYLHRKSYNDEYQKEIIKKQLKAYKPIENIVKKLNVTYERIENKKTEIRHEIFKTNDNFNEFFDSFHDMALNSYLYSKHLVELNATTIRFFLGIKDQIKKNENFNDTKNNEELTKYRICLQHQYIQDLIELKNVNKFLKSRSKALKHILYEYRKGRIARIKNWLYKKKEKFFSRRHPCP